MLSRERWRPGLKLSKGEALQLWNARRRAQATDDLEYDRRLRAIILCGQKRYTQRKVGEMFEVTENCVTRWVMAYRDGGIEALRPRRWAGGRKPQLKEKQLDRLEKLIESGPESCGFDTGVWTSAMVADLIKAKFKVGFSAGHVRKLLSRLGFSQQYPKQIASEASLRKQKTWLRTSYPRIKKKLKPKGASSSSRTRVSFSNQAPRAKPMRSAAKGRS